MLTAKAKMHFSPRAQGSQLLNEVYLIKELVPVEFLRWNYGFIWSKMEGAASWKVKEKLMKTVFEAYVMLCVKNATFWSGTKNVCSSVMEHLSSMHEAPGLIFSTMKQQ